MILLVQGHTNDSNQLEATSFSLYLVTFNLLTLKFGKDDEDLGAKEDDF
jgi:hypothetical protein